MNTATLPWGIIVCVAAAFIAASVQEWFTGQYEVTREGFRIRVTRRWYGTRALVCLRADEDDDKAGRYFVVKWDGKGTDVPWLLVEAMDDYWTAHWAPVTDFAPCTVRRLRPHLAQYGRVLLPQLHVWLPLRQPAGYLGTGA